MWRVLSAVLAALPLLAGPSAASAQSVDPMQAHRVVDGLVAQGKLEGAEAFAKDALEWVAADVGREHEAFASLLTSLAFVYGQQWRHDEAEPLLKQALEIRQKIFQPEHPAYLSSLQNLADLYEAQGRYGKAETFHKRALALREAGFGPEHPEVERSLNRLARLYESQGRYGEARSALERVLTIRERLLGPTDPLVAESLNNLAMLSMAQGGFGETEPLLVRAIAIYEQAYGTKHPSVATGLNNLAGFYLEQGSFDEAEPLYKRVLVILEAVLAADHPDLAPTLGGLAEVYRAQGRHGEMEPLLRRSLEIRQKAYGPSDPRVAIALNNLAGFYQETGRFEDAEKEYIRALEMSEAALGPDHPDVATPLNNLAFLYQATGRLEDSASYHERALAIREKALGADHPLVASTLNNLALLKGDLGRYGDAEALLRRALSILNASVGPNHPDVARTLGNQAAIYRGQGRHDLGLESMRRASAIHRARAARAGSDRSAGASSEQRKARYIFLGHTAAAMEATAADDADHQSLIAEGFEAGQLANASAVGAAVSRMAARFAAGDDALAGLVRERQDAIDFWQRFDRGLTESASAPPELRDKGQEQAMRQALSELDRRIDGIDARLATDFPQFAELSSPVPVSLAETQSLLAADEALLTYLVWADRSFVFVVRRDRAEARQIAIGAAELANAVASLRKALDPKSDVRTIADIPPFDTTQAHQLYRKIFQPVEPLLEGLRHLFVVPDGALQSLPLGVLVMEESAGDFTDFSGYKQTQWLARRYAVTTLPSGSALRALRRFAKRARATRPFLGIGDPQLKGKTGSRRGSKLASLFTARGTADVEAVRKLASLPDTAEELEALRMALGAGDGALLLGKQATETRVKQAPLADYKVLAFATHGLVAGELTGLAEPALVLTPPDEGSELDDGLLTASEIAQLKLDADWVILSACNTAVPDGTPGAEGLSGLAKAFFYAGSRTLLASHWPVDSQAAVQITTRMLREAAKPGVGRSEAHRRAMVSLIEDEERPYFAHPIFWAPFVVVGEGGLAPG